MTDLDLPPRLHFSGGRMLKPNGEELILRGVSFGSWGNDDPLDAAPVKALGANCVRIALRWWMQSDHGADSRDNNGFAFLSRAHVAHWLDLITSAVAAGLWVVPFIDSNCGQNGLQDPATCRYCDPYGQWGATGRNFYTDPAMARVFTDIVWPAAALKLRTLAKIAMLEIHAEPAGDRGPEYAAPVARLQRAIINGIRAVDADTPVLIGARKGYEISLVEEAVDALAATGSMDNIAVTGNLLSQYVTNPDKFDAGLHALTSTRDRYALPVFVQQLGRKTGNDRDMSYMRRALQRMNEERVGFAWWQWKQETANPDSYALNVKTDDGAGWIAKTDEQACLAEFL